MSDNVLVALVDLRIAMGKLKSCLEDVEKVLQELLAAELDVRREETEDDDKVQINHNGE